MKIREFLTSRIFLLNFLLLAGIILILFFGLNIFLRSYTRHSGSITVPDFRGLTISEVKRLCDERELRFKIKDSTFVQGIPFFSVVEQSPKPLFKVKKYRTIYLTINTNNPPKVKLPDLMGVQFNHAVAQLESVGLKAGELSYVPGIGKNAVIKVIKDGREIEPGSLVPKGSAIDLVMEDGFANSKVEIQELIGLTIGEARFTLGGFGLNIGSTIFDKDVSDTAKAIIYKQNPKPDSKTMLSQGESIDVWLTTPEKYNKKYSKKHEDKDK